jgi:hypothetical protein
LLISLAQIIGSAAAKTNKKRKNKQQIGRMAQVQESTAMEKRLKRCLGEIKRWDEAIYTYIKRSVDVIEDELFLLLHL